MTAKPSDSYYKRYRTAARRFEAAGAALFAAGAACHAALGASAKWPGLLLGAGVCVFALGAASLSPRNVIKSFAFRCAHEPNAEYAEGLLAALTAQKKIRLTARSINVVESAVLAYACSPGADKELAKTLNCALHERVVKKPLI